MNGAATNLSRMLSGLNASREPTRATAAAKELLLASKSKSLREVPSLLQIAEPLQPFLLFKSGDPDHVAMCIAGCELLEAAANTWSVVGKSRPSSKRYEDSITSSFAAIEGGMEKSPLAECCTRLLFLCNHR